MITVGIAGLRRRYRVRSMFSNSDSEEGFFNEDRELVSTMAEADVVGSLTEGCGSLTHQLAIDLDHQCYLVPSETSGHFHFFIDRPIEHDAYMALLEALKNAGLIEEGYFLAAKARGQTFVAVRPWKKRRDEAIDGSHGSLSLVLQEDRDGRD